MRKPFGAWATVGWPAVSVSIVLFLFLQATTRAATQSITIDEAFNYSLYLSGPFDQIFLARYDANNHVLQTVFSWLTSRSMGISELALRVPSLVGCGLYFWAVLRLSGLLFGGRPAHVLSTVLLAGNPYVLDFFTVARGYGLALAFLSLAVVTAAELAPSGTGRARPVLIGVWSGLSVASNLACIFPVAGLFCALAAIVYPRALHKLLLLTVVPFAILTGSILALPLRTADKASFYVGAESWGQMVESLLNASLQHNGAMPSPGTLRTAFGHLYIWLPPGVFFAIAILVAVFAAVCCRRGKRMDAVLCAIPTFTLALLWAARVLVGLRLPFMRTGLYLLFLMPAGVLAVVRSRGPAKWLCYPLLVSFALAYVSQWNSVYIEDWRYDAGTRDMARSIEAIRACSGRDKLRIGGSWVFVESLNFYRTVNGYSHWLPVERGEASAPADIYYLTDDDANVADKLKLRILARDPISGSVLASP